MRVWVAMFGQVAPSPDISFPHAAMTTPTPTSAPWLKPLTAALKSLDKEQGVRGRRSQHHRGVQHLHPDDMTEVDEVVPRFVSPVWECLAKKISAEESSDGLVDDYVAVGKGEDDYVVGGGGCWLLRSRSQTPRF